MSAVAKTTIRNNSPLHTEFHRGKDRKSHHPRAVNAAENVHQAQQKHNLQAFEGRSFQAFQEYHVHAASYNYEHAHYTPTLKCVEKRAYFYVRPFGVTTLIILTSKIYCKTKCVWQNLTAFFCFFRPVPHDGVVGCFSQRPFIRTNTDDENRRQTIYFVARSHTE